EVRQGTPGEMREDGGDRLTGMAVGGERDDLDPVVAGEEAQQFGAGIAAGAEDGDLHAMSCLQHVQSPDKKKGAPRRTPLLVRESSCRISAWRTGSCVEPSPCRTSCARRRGCRASDSRPI